MSDQRWCPACREWTALVDSGRCSWCDGPLASKRGGWKRPDLRGSRFSTAQLCALHRVHVDQGVSINRLAKRVYARAGYSGHHSAAQAISQGWKRLRLPARSRIESSRLASTKHGMAPKHGPRPGYGTYRRQTLAGREDRPRCAGHRTQPPGKGQCCSRPARVGSDYCYSHDPLRALEVQVQVARMRRHQPERDMLPMAPFAAWLWRLAESHGSLTAAIDAHGFSRIAYRYARGQDSGGRVKDRIARSTVLAWAGRAGATLDAIYGAAANLEQAA